MNAMERRVASLFPGRRGGRGMKVGLEHELLTADARTGGVVAINRLRDVVATGSHPGFVTFEPGGQLELSLPAAASPCVLFERFREVLATVEDECAAGGVQLAADPVDPRPAHDVPLQITSPRYTCMQAHFDQFGPAGRRMMRRTASTQVCLDWWPGRAGLGQWRVLQLAGPFLAAAFTRTEGVASRLATWLGVDPARTAFDGRLLAGDDPVTAYADFAAAATDFLGCGIDAHLTTLFPPVRPRGRYLEVRFPDVQDPAGVAALLRVLALLTYCEDLRGRVLRLLDGEVQRLGDWWWAASIGDADAVDRGEEIVRLAEEMARFAPTGYLPGFVDELGGVA